MTEIIKEKINYITFLQSFAVTLVVIGHSLPHNPGMGIVWPLWAKIIHHTIYSFHMPLFFVLAGFLLMNSFYNKSKSIQNFMTFFTNKIKRIIIPYLGIGTLAYLLKIFVFNRFAYRPAESNLLYYIKSLLIPTSNPNGYLWFLPTIFFIFLISYFILNNKNYKKVNSIIWLIILFFVSFFTNYINDIGWLNINGVFYYLFYFFIGILFFNYKEPFFKCLSNAGINIFVFIMFLGLQILPEFQHHCCQYLIQYLVAICGIFLSFSIAIFFTGKNCKFLWGVIDGYYYQIYILSWFFECGMRIFYQLHLVNYPTVCFLMLVSSFIFPVLITNIIKRYLPKLKIFIGL